MDETAWAPYEPGWLRVGKGVELDIGEVQASPPGGGGGEGWAGMRADALALHIQGWVS